MIVEIGIEATGRATMHIDQIGAQAYRAYRLQPA